MQSDLLGSSTFSDAPNTRSANSDDVKNESITELPRGSRTLSHNRTLEPPRRAANKRFRHSSSSFVGGSTATSPPVASAPIHLANSVFPVPAAGASNPVAGQVGREGRRHAASIAASVTPTATSSANGKSRIGSQSSFSASIAWSTFGASGTLNGYASSVTYISPVLLSWPGSSNMLPSGRSVGAEVTAVSFLKLRLALYDTYAACVKDPMAVSSQLNSKGIFSSLLIEAYDSPPIAVAQLKEAVQDKVSPNVCPMCGSLKTGTADHYFPKEQYPEFSVYSWNLVPACDCNTKRGATLIGSHTDEWIIHPYFETKLAKRVLTVKFDFSLAEPTLSIGKLYSSGIPHATIDFHVEKVHLKTTMLDWVTAEWARLRKVPCHAMTWYPSAVVSVADVKARMLDLVEANDNKLETPNNWTSALFHGVSECQSALDLVTLAINDFIASKAVSSAP